MAKTYNDLYIETRRVLKEAGISAYALEARLIVAHAAEKTSDKLLRDMRLYTADETGEKVRRLLQRRLEGEPLAYITGEWEFYGLPILINENVLIPRVDTEVLVDTALRYLRTRKPDARILDLCAGSGCIGCAIAKHLPESRVVVADISPEAVSLCRKNALMNNLSPRVTCIDADAAGIPPMLVGSFDMIVCNPPYIPTSDLDGLDSSVRDYEPRLALDGGEDGLHFYRIITQNWRHVLRSGGQFVFEVGINQAEAVSHILRMGDCKNIEIVSDTAGIPRVVAGKI